MMPRVIVTTPEELAELVRGVVKEELREARLGVDEVVDARTSGLGPVTFRRLVREGRLPATKIGRRLVVRRSDVDRLLVEQRQREAEARNVAKVDHDPIAAAVASGRLRVLPPR